MTSPFSGNCERYAANASISTSVKSFLARLLKIARRRTLTGRLLDMVLQWLTTCKPFHYSNGTGLHGWQANSQMATFITLHADSPSGWTSGTACRKPLREDRTEPKASVARTEPAGVCGAPWWLSLTATQPLSASGPNLHGSVGGRCSRPF